MQHGPRPALGHMQVKGEEVYEIDELDYNLNGLSIDKLNHDNSYKWFRTVESYLNGEQCLAALSEASRLGDEYSNVLEHFWRWKKRDLAC